MQTGPQLDSELPMVQGTRPRTPACGTMNGSGTLSFSGLQLFPSLKCIPDTDPDPCASHFYVSTYIARWSHSVTHSARVQELLGRYFVDLVNIYNQLAFKER